MASSFSLDHPHVLLVLEKEHFVRFSSGFRPLFWLDWSDQKFLFHLTQHLIGCVSLDKNDMTNGTENF